MLEAADLSRGRRNGEVERRAERLPDSEALMGWRMHAL